MIDLFAFTRDARALADQLEAEPRRHRADLRQLERDLPSILRDLALLTEELASARAVDQLTAERRSA